MKNTNYGDRPGGHGQGGVWGSVADQWTEQVIDQVDPLAPTRSHESPATYDPEDNASHAAPPPCPDSELGCGGMPTNRYRARAASQTL
ncbi:hypothetical protein BH09ACT7_BH09ACT7_16140 [soil metagenome]